LSCEKFGLQFVAENGIQELKDRWMHQVVQLSSSTCRFFIFITWKMAIVINPCVICNFKKL